MAATRQLLLEVVRELTRRPFWMFKAMFLWSWGLMVRALKASALQPRLAGQVNFCRWSPVAVALLLQTTPEWVALRVADC